MAYDAAEWPVSEFEWGYLARDPILTWADLENLQMKEYADERTEREPMGSLMKLAQI